MQIKLLTALDNFIFRRVYPEHNGVTGVVFLSSLLYALGLNVLAFILQMMKVEDPWFGIVVVTGYVLIGAVALVVSLPAIKAFPTTAGQGGYALYVALFVFAAVVSVLYILIAVVIAVCGYYLLKSFFNGDMLASLLEVKETPKKKYYVEDEYGRREVKKTGVGACGEKTFEDKDGRQFMKY